MCLLPKFCARETGAEDAPFVVEYNGRLCAKSNDLCKNKSVDSDRFAQG